MNENGMLHPGRSVEFLSRLHDGELQPSERVRFEAHRAHCGECRRAAIEFEDALSLFRSTRSTPPRSDLAARILRKVQTTNRPRAPFPMRFRIDLGWAALLLTALFAILITTPLIVRRSPTAPGERAAAPPPAAERPGETGGKVAAAPPKISESRARAASRRPPTATADAPKPPGRENAPGAQKEEALRDSRAERETVAARQAPSIEGTPKGFADRAGGEGDASPSIAAAIAAIHLSIHEADGFGPPPDVLRGVWIDLPAAERGREYLVMVDSQGTVRSVSRASEDSDRGAAAPAPRRSIAKAEAGAAASPLFRLRFESGNRPRRLRVRID
jgi:Putative zinc-finger